MSHQGHVSFFSLIGPVGLFLLRHDLARVDIEGDLPDRGSSRLSPSSPQPLSQNGDDPVDHPLHRRESRTFSAHPSEPSSEGVRRGNRIDSQKGQEPRIPPDHPKIRKAPSSSIQHQQKRKNIGRGRISRSAPRGSKGPVNLLPEIQGVKKLPEQDQTRL
jgi:hypothetical protein